MGPSNKNKTEEANHKPREKNEQNRHRNRRDGLSYQQRPKLTEIHHQVCDLCLKRTLRVVVRRQALDRDVNHVTRLFARRQLTRPVSVGRPKAPNRGGDGRAKLGASLRSFWSV